MRISRFFKKNWGLITVIMVMAVILSVPEVSFAGGVDEILGKLNGWWSDIQKLFRRLAEIAVAASMLCLIIFIAISKSEQGVPKAKKWLLIDSIAAAGLVIWEMWLAIFK